MLSQPASNTRLRRQAHRRQQSTPTVFDAAQLSSRMNLGDQQRGVPAHALVPQEHPQVSMTNNPGQQDLSQHFHLQVAQQQYHTRPGPPPPPPPPPPSHLSSSSSNVTQALSEAEFRQLQHQQLDAHIDLLMRQQGQPRLRPGSKEFEQHNHKIERSRSHPEQYNGMHVASQGALQQSLALQHDHQQRPSSSRSAGFNEDRFSLHPTIDIPLQQRPATPPNQSNFDYSPMTPATTPFHHQHHLAQATPSTIHSTVAQNLSENDLYLHNAPVAMHAHEDQLMSDPDATIKPSRRAQLSRVISFTEFFNDGNALAANGEMLPTPPSTKEVHTNRTIDLKVAGISLEEVPKLELQPVDVGSGLAFFDHASYSESQQHGPMDMMPMFAQSPAHSHRTSVDFSAYTGSPMRGPVSPKNVPMEDLSLEATIEDTGVSAEEVQSYIQEPTDEEPKWCCLFPECDKKFGRKENIRSHVQTHLGDRQFKCIHCNKCFVRQHDLKRHSKIHSGVKPYPCICGNSFARHDALTRHRQRGICTGGFEGIVKKNVKRGRPRKERPEDDERLNKSAKTRMKVKDRSYASSVSGTSESSWAADSPESAVDGFAFAGSEAEQLRLNLLQYDHAGFHCEEELAHSPPMSPNTTTNAGSPIKGQETVRAGSEGAKSAHADVQEQVGGTSTCQSSQQGSQAGSPPGLSHSSPPSSAQMMDFDLGLSNSGSSAASQLELQSHDFDMFVNDGNGDELFGSQYEQALFNLDKMQSGGAGFSEEDLFGDSLEL